MVSDMAMTSDLPDGLARGEEAIEVARRRGNRYTESVAASNMLYTLLYLGDFDRVEREIAEILEAGGENRPQVEYLYTRGLMLAIWRGDAEAIAAGLALIEPLRASDVVDDICAVAMLDTAFANYEGRHADALEYARRVLDRMQVQIGVRHESVRPTWDDAVDAALKLGDTDGADEILARIRDLPPGFVPPYLRAGCSRFGARIAAARGDAETAERLFVDAEQRLAELGYDYWLARARLDHAQWLMTVDRTADAPDLAAQAAATFDRLKAPLWRERAEAITPETVAV